MANQLSSDSILCASFNQDNSCFAIGTKDGVKIFDSNTGKLLYERAIGAFTIVEMLFNSSLLAIVGAGDQASLSPRRLWLFNTTKGTALRKLNFLTSILAIRVNMKRLIVIFLEKTYIYDLNSLEILDTLDTVRNLKGLCAFSPSLPGSFLAIPASTVKGSVLVYNVMELHSHCEIDAHRSPLAAMVLSSNGMYIATASEQGTIIRVHLLSDVTKSYSFRRGTCASTIFSLSFGPSIEQPDILLASSSSGAVHIFSLGYAFNQRSRRSSNFLGSIMPDSVTDALDPALHHVLHHAVPAGMKSNAVIRSMRKLPGNVLKATISIITNHGYYLDYGLTINHQNETSWTLERELNLLTVHAEKGINSKVSE